MRWSIFLIAMTGFVISAIIQNDSLYSQKKYSYVGSSNCKKCHEDEVIGNQYKIWSSSHHSRSFKTLLTEKGKLIAEKNSIVDPSTDEKCLKCHTTGGGKSEITKQEGVGCEACHGPGSSYNEFSNHVNLGDREEGYKLAIKHGMYPTRGVPHLKNRERMCLRCHSNERPCFPEDAAEIQKQKITIQVVDTLIKSEKKFSHPLRRR